ncbi:glycosyltransferase [Corynebacterium epidermidicanis]|uniref:Glycosyl transferase n=1 Tax=Corynebacterium epidermidicanis TaxID=1050174 RepID=A0A0G3GLC5_9CORY|nr:glycosyltransferase [Corynebacterium epidermidicanis]AKK02036.1 glycosyl transferase [Corynebacterium epidermidicanis]
MGSALDVNSLNVLFATDVKYSVDSSACYWIEGFLSKLVEDGNSVTFVQRERQADDLHTRLAALGIEIIPAIRHPEEAYDGTGVLGRFAARQVVRLSRKESFDLVITQGLELCVFVAGAKENTHNLWCIPEYNPTTNAIFSEADLQEISKLAPGAKTVLFSNNVLRGQVESRYAQLTSKTRLLPNISMRKSGEVQMRNEAGLPTLYLDFPRLEREYDQIDFERCALEAKFLRDIVRVVVCGIGGVDEEEVSARLDRIGISSYPALEFEDREFQHCRYRSYEAAVLISDPNGATSQIASISGIPVASLEGSPSYADLVRSLKTRVELSGGEDKGSLFFSNFASDLADYKAIPLHTEPKKVLVVGADLKFAGDMLDALVQRRDIELKIDKLASNGRVEPQVSTQFLEWADAIIVEFASVNAVWYSNAVSPRQKLFVHLHGYELYSDWIGDLNIDGVAAVVVASEFYRDKVLEKMGWPSHKVVVIPNSVKIEDLNREKDPESKYHIGLIGYVPILKRPDRALDLLDKLLEFDDRFTLHVKGHAPWNYPWEWSKSIHQDQYRDFFRRIGESPGISKSISFEPFGPDIGNWFSKIGWILSPSYRETFHLAAIEGACSGAVPLAWRREGSEEIIGSDYNFKNTDEVVDFVLDVIQSGRYEDVSKSASDFAQRYSAEIVRERWLDLVFSIDDLSSGSLECPDAAVSWIDKFKAPFINSLPATEANLCKAVSREMARHDVEQAMALLDENINITAHKRGVVKDLELYVRGLFALDERKYDLLINDWSGVEPSKELKDSAVLIEQGQGLRAFELFAPRDAFVHVSPPNWFKKGKRDLYRRLDGDAPFEVEINGDYRFDRWVELAKARLIQIVAELGADQIVAYGPLWLALPAALAANQLNIGFVWAVEKNENGVVERVGNINSASPDIEAQLAKILLENADLRMVEIAGGRDYSGFYWYADAALGSKKEKNGQLEVFSMLTADKAFAQDRVSRKRELPTRSKAISEYFVAIFGIGEEIRSAISQSQMRCFEIFDTNGVTSDLDLLLVWGDALERSNFQLDQTIEFISSARSKGIPVCLVYCEKNVPSSKMIAVARLCDMLAFSWLPGSSPILQLNPLTVSRLTFWDNQRAMDENVAMVLRALAEPVVVTRNEKRMANELTADSKLCVDTPTDNQAVDLFASHEKVSVIIATHKGVHRIRQCLESISSQTLPQHLIELVIIENGIADGTKKIVDDFRAANPGISIVYQFSKIASAGNARNIGLDLADGAYVTFVDDDDYLEENYLLSMWLSAGDDSVVVGGLTDRAENGTYKRETPNNLRLSALQDDRVPLAKRSGLLFMNSCKLIPAKYLKRIRYASELSSGEDIVFMSQLLNFKDLKFVGAANLEKADYIRVLRDESISRQAMTFDFGIVQRVAVLNALTDLKGTLPKEAHRAIEVIQDAQASFIRKYRKEMPGDENKVTKYLAENLKPVSAGVNLA